MMKSKLTKKELKRLEVIQLSNTGLNVHEIAEKLGYSLSTVYRAVRNPKKVVRKEKVSVETNVIPEVKEIVVSQGPFLAKSRSGNSFKIITKRIDNKFTVDSEGFLDSVNDEPAYVDYYANGKVKSQTHFKNGRRHREGDKPAHILFSKSGKVRYSSFWNNGKTLNPIDKTNWEKVEEVNIPIQIKGTWGGKRVKGQKLASPNIVSKEGFEIHNKLMKEILKGINPTPIEKVYTESELSSILSNSEKRKEFLSRFKIIKEEVIPVTVGMIKIKCGMDKFTSITGYQTKGVITDRKVINVKKSNAIKLGII